MKQPILIILFFLMIGLTASSADACLNPIGRYQVGKRIKVDGISAQDFARDFVSHEDRKYWEKVKADIERRKKSHPYIDNRNNLAVALIHLGQIKAAIEILEELETKTPGQYVTAANLGTAYELNGENQKALDWIKQCINRKNESHYGTEWLHVKILETKLAMEKDANWLNNHSVLDMDFGSGDLPQHPNKLTTDYLGQQKSLTEIEDALIYQLHERLEFVKPPEPIVAELLLDLSKVFALTRTPEHTKAIYNLATNYGATPTEKIENSQPVKNTEITADNSKNYILYVILGMIGLTVITSIFIIVRKRKLQ